MQSARFPRLLVLTLLILAIPAASFAGIFVSITVAPPPLPVYVQPVCPQPGYMWTPGYWAWSDDGYYWVPGTWVPAPAVGLLVDARVLGLVRWILSLERRLLGTSYRLLRRGELRFRVWRRGIRRRGMAPRRILLITAP